MEPMAPPSEQEEQPLGGAAERRRPSHLPVPAALELALRAEWVAASVVRQRVEGWLLSLRWPPAQIDELVLSVSEAVSNSIEHGYLVPPDVVDHPGIVHVRGRVVVERDGYRRAEFTVRDEGAWREPVGGASSRGHGMLIMRTCTDRFTVDHGPDGTTVVLVGRPTPPPLEG
jgi:anti-sigma regulatory factor (Ser/Thr protein kinase)